VSIGLAALPTATGAVQLTNTGVVASAHESTPVTATGILSVLSLNSEQQLKK